VFSKSHFLIFLILLIQPCQVSGAQVSLKPFQAGPDQVLVLYNADWEIDADLTAPGQDSKEVADYYVKMHTDPDTGKRPYQLGLRCRHGQKHLNHWLIKEESQDNKNGVVFVGQGQAPGPKEWPRDSRQVEIVLNPDAAGIDWNSVKIWCRSAGSKVKALVSPLASGIPQKKGNKVIYPDISENEGRCYRFDAHQQYKGTVFVSLQAGDPSGKLVRDFTVTYYDRDDFRFSAVGPDGISDEKNLQEDVIIPLKAFLEDPAHALPDGTLLKDHILYMVIVHGLPFSCEAVFGIERGITDYAGNHGDLASLEQRLQTLYYDWGKRIQPPVITMYMARGPESDKGVRNYRITTAMRHPLFGPRANPYMHPDTYSFLGERKEVRFLDLPPFGEVRKKVPPYLFAYAVSRLDGQGADVAKRQIDYSLYASKYLRPEMDRLVREDLRKRGRHIGTLAPKLETAEKMEMWGAEEEDVLGFRVLSPKKGQGLPFLGRPLEDSLTPGSGSDQSQAAPYVGFYPGGMERTVFSGNGWNLRKSAAIWRQVDQGVSISACGGPASYGGPHITNATFWDNRVLMRYLFRGRDLGECFLLSTAYVNWATSLVGDPLLHADLSTTVLDDTAPKVDKDHIKIEFTPAVDKFAGTLEVPVVHTKRQPEVAKLEVYYSKTGQQTPEVSRSPIYSTHPRVILRDLDPNTTYSYRPILEDPYGNRTDLSVMKGPLDFRTGSLPRRRPFSKTASQGAKGFEIDLSGRHLLTEKGTIRVEFIAGERGLLPNIKAKDLRLKTFNLRKDKMTVEMSVGAPEQEWKVKSPLREGESARLELRWRRVPLTRELLLIAKDGREFTLAADVRTPWEEPALGTRLLISEHDRVKILAASVSDDAQPASSQACRIGVLPVDEDVWAASNR
jgi:hypothetical protein